MSKLDELINTFCPEGVEYKKLKEVATISRGGSFQKKDYVEDGFPCIHYGQIYTLYSLFVNETANYISNEIADKQKKAETNDVIMAVTSENMEDVCKCVAWLGEGEVAVSGHTAIIHHTLDPKYLVYWLHSSMFYTQKVKLAHGTKVMEVKPDSLGDVILPVPPKEVQSEIVRVLDQLTELTTKLTAELTKDDQPTVYYNMVKDETVFRSPVATAVDYTVFVGTPDEIIATFRELTGPCPEMPKWALGYIHCRERFHSSQEILETANRFKAEQMPVSMLVQDWQWWGKHGWNAMEFDEDNYPDPKALTDSLHRMDIRLMLSVWSKIDKTSEVGRQMESDGYYIPETDWIDFFNPEAAAAYWKNFNERLVPTGIDAWWQDATEPENDDLAGRRVNNGRWSGEQVRNVYPLLVNKTVYEGLVNAGKEPMILTRCGFPGIQRYGSALWSGDVGNDWNTFRRQIVAGLGVQAAGHPWWTYDAGGFFRPRDQYSNQDYIERMLRWIETSVYLPLMRVHGYMSNTEPWNYGDEAKEIIAKCLKEREQLRPYIEKCAERVAKEGYTLMRPLVFDFADDETALWQSCEYMFGPELLVSPVTEPGVKEWKTYLPKQKGGWTEIHTNEHFDGGQYVTTKVSKAYIPVFRRIKN